MITRIFTQMLEAGKHLFTYQTVPLNIGFASIKLVINDIEITNQGWFASAWESKLLVECCGTPGHNNYIGPDIPRRADLALMSAEETVGVVCHDTFVHKLAKLTIAMIESGVSTTKAMCAVRCFCNLSGFITCLHCR